MKTSAMPFAFGFCFGALTVYACLQRYSLTPLGADGAVRLDRWTGHMVEVYTGDHYPHTSRSIGYSQTPKPGSATRRSSPERRDVFDDVTAMQLSSNQLPIRVKIPNFGVVEFPGHLTHDEIAALIISNMPAMAPSKVPK